jgi:hypothetical protein
LKSACALTSGGSPPFDDDTGGDFVTMDVHTVRALTNQSSKPLNPIIHDTMARERERWTWGAKGIYIIV